MNYFLRGFTDELIKLGQPAPGIIRPPSTATGTEPRVPRPPNLMTAGRGDMLGAIPTQRMESPAKTTPQTWRPSPGYNPKPSSDPVTPPPARRGGGLPKPREVEPAWETAGQRRERRAGEAAYNAGDKRAPQYGSFQPMTPGGYNKQIGPVRRVGELEARPGQRLQATDYTSSLRQKELGDRAKAEKERSDRETMRQYGKKHGEI